MDAIVTLWLIFGGGVAVCILVALASQARRGTRQAKPTARPTGAARRPPAPVRPRPDRPSEFLKLHPPASREIKGTCHVIDGDTIVIGRTKLRLAGVDAPELDMPWGQKSKWAMVELCKGQQITAVCTGEQSYDRLVATCYLPDGRDLGAALIRQGLALDYPHFSGGKYKHLEPKGARRKLKWVYIKERQERTALAHSGR